MSSEVLTVMSASTAEYEIKKSLFIGAIFPCQSEREALQQLNSLAAKHSTANHLAFAWRIRLEDGFINERANDGGEPSGTAGRPILAPLEGQKIQNAVVGVIRYFGGIKLGTGGLARAYGNAAKLAIEQAPLSPWVEMVNVKLELEYAQLQMLEYQLPKYNGVMLDQQFTERVVVLISLPLEHKKTIEALFSEYPS